jgi:hypothetical protein
MIHEVIEGIGDYVIASKAMSHSTSKEVTKLHDITDDVQARNEIRHGPNMRSSGQAWMNHGEPPALQSIACRSSPK